MGQVTWSRENKGPVKYSASQSVLNDTPRRIFEGLFGTKGVLPVPKTIHRDEIRINDPTKKRLNPVRAATFESIQNSLTFP